MELLYFLLFFSSTTLFFETQLCLSSMNTRVLVLPLKTQVITTSALPRSPGKLRFSHNVSLVVELAVGTPPQNVSVVIDTGSELSWLHCNKTRNFSASFDPTRSASYAPVPCSSPTCTTRTRDFPIPASCDARDLCHAVLSYADFSSTEGNLAADVFRLGESDISGVIFGCMDSVFSSAAEDPNSTGLMGMNRGSLSFVSQVGFSKFSYCISGSDASGLMMLGGTDVPWLAPLNYTQMIQIASPLPYFDRAAYTVRLEGIKVLDRPIPLPESVLVPDHTGAGQTMVDSGTQFSFLLGPVYTALRNEFLNRTAGSVSVLDEPDFVFQGAMDLCYLIPMSLIELPPLPTVGLVFRGAEMTVSGESTLYRVPGETRGNDSIYCFTFGNSDLLGVEAYVIGHHHQQNTWMEFDLENSRIGLAHQRCDLAARGFADGV